MRVLFVIVLMLFSSSILAKSFLFMSYNVEQLYDNVDNLDVEDSRFLPSSKPPYTIQVMNQKLQNIAKVILEDSAGSYFGVGPDVVSLVEVENINILKLLAKKLNSKIETGSKYKAYFVKGDDISGINPGFLSKFDLVDVIGHKVHKLGGREWIIPSIPFVDGKPIRTVTRDILEGSFFVDGKKVTIFANHWPAKNKSLNIARKYECGKYLNKLISKKLKDDPTLNVVVAGDFNANPEDASLLAGLGVSDNLIVVMESTPAKPVLYGTSYDIYNKSKTKNFFYRTMENFKKNFFQRGGWRESDLKELEQYYFDLNAANQVILKFIKSSSSFDRNRFNGLHKTLLANILQKRGTFYYRRGNEWSNLDTIHISKTLIDNNGLDYIKGSFRILRKAYMVFNNGKPLAFHKCKRASERKGCLKTPDGSIIRQGGYADHFPVLVNFIIR